MAQAPSKTASQAMRDELVSTEVWAQLAVAIGYDPLDVEGQGRDILKRMSAMGVKPAGREKGNV